MVVRIGDSLSRIAAAHLGDSDRWVEIWDECQADAKQFIEIQDSLWAETDETSESSGGADKPADL